MAALYTNYNGQPVSNHSYSGGSQFTDCPRRYEYHRKQGYREKSNNASMEFGNAWEAALQTYHKNYSTQEALAEWDTRWAYAATLDLYYKDTPWEEMNEQGIELLRLYFITLPRLPITQNVRFQLNFKKEVFPDSEYAGIHDQGFVDMLVENVPEHYLLPPTTQSPRSMIVDIKTSGKAYPQDARLLRLDRQLRRYSWQSGIETVAFLVGVRNSRNLSRGDNVTLLRSTVDATAGDEFVVFDATDFGVRVVSEESYQSYLIRQKGIRGKQLEALKELFAEEFSITIRADDLTRQKIQFLATTIGQRERHEEGELVGEEIVDIRECEVAGFYPQKPGIRFPNSRCLYCPCLGLCIGDENMVQQKLINISKLPPQSTDWLDAMLED